MRVIEHILATRVIGVSLFQAFVTWGAPRKTAVENNSFFWEGGGGISSTALLNPDFLPRRLSRYAPTKQTPDICSIKRLPVS